MKNKLWVPCRKRGKTNTKKKQSAFQKARYRAFVAVPDTHTHTHTHKHTQIHAQMLPYTGKREQKKTTSRVGRKVGRAAAS